MREDLTDKEKQFLSMLFKIGHIVTDEISKDSTSILSFDRDDLFNLARKLGIDY